MLINKILCQWYNNKPTYIDISTIYEFIQPYIAEVLYKSTRPIEFDNCMTIYNKSLSWNDVFVYEACFRDMLGVNTDFGRIKIFKKVYFTSLKKVAFIFEKKFRLKDGHAMVG